MLSTLALLAFLTPQTTWHVDVNGTAPGSGTPSDPYTRIDYAVAQASTLDGDIIRVQPGEYLNEAIDFAGKDLHVISSDGAATTTLVNSSIPGSLAQPLVRFSGGESPAAILEGFTLDGSGGAPHPNDPTRIGGADIWIDNAFPTIRDCVLTSEWVPGIWFGRLVYAHAQFPTDSLHFDGCEFTGGNAGAGEGGAFFMEGTSAEFLDCTIANSGGGQAGAYLARQCTISMYGCTLNNNSTGLAGGHGRFRDCNVILNSCSVSNGFSTSCGAGFMVENGTLWIQDCQFSNNSSTCGGALYLTEVSATIEASQFDGNVSAEFDFGGAILQRNGQLQIEDCSFDGNFASMGGAIATSESPVLAQPNPNVWTRLQNCQLNDNRAESIKSVTRPSGGAIFAATTLTIEHCSFEDNLAHWMGNPGATNGAFGGALYMALPGQVTDSSFLGNRARSDNRAQGGAVHATAPVDLQGCVFEGNGVEGAFDGDGGALYGETHATRCTLRGNTCDNGGLSAVQGGSLTHSIVWGNPAPGVDPAVLAHYSLIEGGANGLGILDTDPLFWGPDDHHLMPGSPAIDAGDANLPSDRNGTLADLGALPFDPLHCGPGCSGEIGANSCAALPNSTGHAASLSGLGSDLAGNDLLILHASNLPAGMPGYFLASQDPGYLPGFGGSDGVLCLGPPVLLRFNEQVRWSGSIGQITQRLALGAFPQGHMVLPGDTWYFQLWHRDYIGVNPTSNTTPALRVDFQ
ncbi:MAG: right-handed parallel beta-helix repeat-containing protein [Planctomycetota bacterium]|nr:right-handed parallel beta-helix repeat-containing protein [Planctomycetota bacterium]